MAEFAWLALKLAVFHALLAELLKAGQHPGRWRFATMLRAFGFMSVAWVLLQAVLALILLWPIQAVQETRSLFSALTLSLAAGVVVLGLQRIWPNWAQWQQDHRQGWPTLDGASAVFGFWRSALAGLVLLLLAVPALLTATGWAFWPSESSLWLLAYGVLALVWHAVAVNVALPRHVAMPAAAATVPAARLELDPDLGLLQAVHNGQVDAALAALASGANPHQLPGAGAKDQRSLMMVAAALSDLRLLRALIGHGVDVNAFHAGLNPLLGATRDSWHGRPEAVTMLLANGARTDVADTDGNSPLHHAMRSTDAAVAALLLDAGADKEAVNKEGFTPLALACQAANWRVARYMLERKAQVEPAGAEPVLLAAAGAEDDDIGVRLLHKHKARIDVRGRLQRTPLMAAAQAGLVEVTAVLLELGAQVNARDEAGCTAYMLAAQAGETEVLKKLQESPKLERAALDAQGKSALAHALANGRWSAVACIDPSYALPERLSQEPERAARLGGPQQLSQALAAGEFAAAEQLLQAGLVPDGADLAELLFESCRQDRRAAARWLLARGAHLFSADEHGLTVYRRLLQTGLNPSAQLAWLLEAAQPISGGGSLAAYLESCLHNDFSRRADEQFALQLLQQGADPFGVSPLGLSPPIVLSVRLGWPRLSDALLASGVDANAADRAGLSAVHFAAQSGRTDLLRPLIAAGGDPERRAGNGQSAFGMALLGGHGTDEHCLVWPNWPLPGRRLRGCDLPAAALAKDFAAVEKLLGLGIAVDAYDQRGSTALIHACGQGQLALVHLLLARGADPGLPAQSGATALWAAISQNQGEVVAALLAAGADANQAVAGFPPLNLACRSGAIGLAGALLEHGADAAAADAQGQNALHAGATYLASEAARLECVILVDMLLRAGVAGAAADKFGQTPMHLLCGAGLQKGQGLKEDLVLSALDRLLQETPTVDALDSRGFTPLHHAAARGYSQLAARLLRAGADRNRRDNLGRSACDFAVMGGFSATADLLQDRPDRIDIASLLVRKDQA